MRLLLLAAAVVFPSSAMADACIKLEGGTLSNECQKCMEVTVRALSPPGEQATRMFASEHRPYRLEAGARTTLLGGDRFAIVDLKACQ